MAKEKITGMTELAAADVASGDLVEIVDVSDTTAASTGTNKKLDILEYLTELLSSGDLATITITGVSTSDSLIVDTALFRNSVNPLQTGGIIKGASVFSADIYTLDGTDGGGVLATQEWVEVKVPYTTYVAMLNQSGTDAPVATVLQNTMSAAIVWSRSGQGEYTGTLAGAFTNDKTFILFSRGDIDESIETNYLCDASNITANTINIGTSAAGSFSDGLLVNTMIEIRVYP